MSRENVYISYKNIQKGSVDKSVTHIHSILESLVVEYPDEEEECWSEEESEEEHLEAAPVHGGHAGPGSAGKREEIKLMTCYGFILLDLQNS